MPARRSGARDRQAFLVQFRSGLGAARGTVIKEESMGETKPGGAVEGAARRRRAERAADVRRAAARGRASRCSPPPPAERARALAKGEARLGLVVLDLVLPDVEGLELFRAIRAARPEVPVVMLTAYGSVDTAVQALREGAYHFLTKPADLEQWRALVRSALEKRALEEENRTLRERLGRGRRRRADRALPADGGAARVPRRSSAPRRPRCSSRARAARARSWRRARSTARARGATGRS